MSLVFEVDQHAERGTSRFYVYDTDDLFLPVGVVEWFSHCARWLGACYSSTKLKSGRQVVSSWGTSREEAFENAQKQRDILTLP